MNDNITMVQIAHVQVKDKNFNAVISMCPDSMNLHIFKYNDYGCDYEVFQDKWAATLYLEQQLEPFPDDE